jgi:DNA polymerase I-like protein with 3'-5' exonuclease and polymerase domains
MGRKRIFFGRWGKELVKSRLAFEPQAIEGDLIGTVMIRLQEVIDEFNLDIQLLLQVHDELSLQCGIEDRPWVILLLRWAFNVPVKIGRHTLNVPVEIKSGPNWQDCVEVK